MYVLLISVPPEAVPCTQQALSKYCRCVSNKPAKQRPSPAMHSLLAAPSASVLMGRPGAPGRPFGALLHRSTALRPVLHTANVYKCQVYKLGAFGKSTFGRLVIGRRSNRCIHTHWVACNLTYVIVQYVIEFPPILSHTLLVWAGRCILNRKKAVSCVSKEVCGK